MEVYIVINVKDKSFLIKFGNHLRFLRKQIGISQEELANRADISISQVSRVERGEINTTISTVKVISEALNISVVEIFKFVLKD